MRGDGSWYPEAAAKALLDTLACAGTPVSSPHGAVRLGYITMLDWCDVLETYREQAREQERQRRAGATEGRPPR